MKTFAIIPAGGKGLRSGTSVPKQYIKINGRELITYTISTFQNCRNINYIVVAAEKSYHKKLKRIIDNYKFNKVISIIEGGKTRQDSVFNCIKSLKADKNDLIIVHDAARPLLSKNILNNSINLAKEKGSAVVSIKAKDTLVTGNKTIVSYLDRRKVYYVQTPQIFKYKDFIKAIKYAEKNKFYGSDESSIMKKIGKRINIVEGSSINIKITTKEDLKILEIIIKQSD